MVEEEGSRDSRAEASVKRAWVSYKWVREGGSVTFWWAVLWQASMSASLAKLVTHHWSWRDAPPRGSTLSSTNFMKKSEYTSIYWLCSLLLGVWELRWVIYGCPGRCEYNTSGAFRWLFHDYLGSENEYWFAMTNSLAVLWAYGFAVPIAYYRSLPKRKLRFWRKNWISKKKKKMIMISKEKPKKEREVIYVRLIVTVNLEYKTINALLSLILCLFEFTSDASKFFLRNLRC